MNEEQKEWIRQADSAIKNSEEGYYFTEAKELFPEAFNKPEREGLNVRIEWDKYRTYSAEKIQTALYDFFDFTAPKQNLSVKEIGAGFTERDMMDFLEKYAGKYSHRDLNAKTYFDEFVNSRKEKNK